MADNSTPNPNTGKMERDRGQSNMRGGPQPESAPGKLSEWGEGTSEGAGISNRPEAEEQQDQDAVPERGQTGNER